MEYQYEGLQGSIEVPVMVKFKWPDGTNGEHPLAIGPEFSLGLTPSSDVIPTDLRGSRSVKGTARDQSRASHAQIELKVPEGWRAEPAAGKIQAGAALRPPRPPAKVSRGRGTSATAA